MYGLTAPLLTTSEGKKMGKTASGAVWLNADLLSPFEYWQFWRNTADADVGRFLRIFTELPRDRIEGLEALKGAQINDAKRVRTDHPPTDHLFAQYLDHPWTPVAAIPMRLRGRCSPMRPQRCSTGPAASMRFTRPPSRSSQRAAARVARRTRCRG